MKKKHAFYERHYCCIETWKTSFLNQDRIKKIIKEFSKNIDGKRDKTIIDMASGSGELIEYLYKKYPKNIYYANEISNKAVNIKRKDKKFPIKWTVEDLNYKLSYPSSFADIIIAGEIIEHLFDTDNFLKEVYRILKPKAILIITTPNLASFLDRIFLLLGLQPFSTDVSYESRLFGRELFYKLINSSESASNDHLRCFTKGALRSVLRFYKFKIIKEDACHLHDIKLNKLITKLLPNFSQSQLIVAEK